MMLLTRLALMVMLAGISSNSETDAAPTVDRLEDRITDEKSRLRRDTLVMMDFLPKYGYLQDDVPDGYFHSEETIAIAIKEFQKFNGLKVTGVPDLATINKMKAPRCGLPDNIHSGNPSNKALAYTTMRTRWGKNALTWMPTKLSRKMRENDQLSAMRAAFAVWADVTPLSFEYTNYQPDIEIKFVAGEHGDGEHNKFDGRGGVLAHAFGPGANLGGDTHFDEEEDWTIGTGYGTDLVQVAAHEFGHALGLGHSNVPDALMAPFYTYTDKLALKDDDIQGIQAIYGARVKRPTTTVPAVRSTVTTATSVSSTSTSSSTKVWTPDYCKDNFKLDAITRGTNEELYAFRNDLVYKFNGQGMQQGYPKLISQVFPQGPKMSLNAATFVPETGKFYIFKGFQVWRYTNFTLDSNYPKTWTRDKNFIPSAALTLTYRSRSQIFMFGSNYFWDWNQYTEKIVPGYPLATQKYFPHAPNMPDAAFMNQQGHFFFFKGNSYKKLEQRGKDSDFKPLSQNLFGSVCGGQSELLNVIKQHSLSDQDYKNPRDIHIPEPSFSTMIWTLINQHKDTDREKIILHKAVSKFL